jgi:hypothetical protein
MDTRGKGALTVAIFSRAVSFATFSGMYSCTNTGCHSVPNQCVASAQVMFAYAATLEHGCLRAMSAVLLHCQAMAVKRKLFPNCSGVIQLSKLGCPAAFSGFRMICVGEQHLTGIERLRLFYHVITCLFRGWCVSGSIGCSPLHPGGNLHLMVDRISGADRARAASHLLDIVVAHHY